MSTVRQVIEQTYTKVNGEYESLSETGDDFRTYLVVLNQALETWAHTPYVKWQSLFDTDFTLADRVADGVFAYDIPDADRLRLASSPYDSVYFVDDNGAVVDEYKLLDQAQFQATNEPRVAALLGERLYLKSTNEKNVGSLIKLPVYKLPTKYTTAAQTVRVDSVPWLVTYMAASICDASPVPFIARNADKYYSQAEILMKGMKDDNRRRQALNIKGTTGSVRRTWADVMQSMTLKDL